MFVVVVCFTLFFALKSLACHVRSWSRHLGFFLREKSGARAKNCSGYGGGVRTRLILDSAFDFSMIKGGGLMILGK